VQTFAASFASTPTFVVGDGTNTAEFNLLGGTNSFATGLRVASGSLLTATAPSWPMSPTPA